MGKYFNKFKNGAKKVDNKLANWQNEKERQKDSKEDRVGDFADYEEDYDDERDYEDERYDDMAIPPAQRPESFHHFILENQYRDLERSIRGFKDVFDKSKQQWVTKRKEHHCFTDEEAEGIIRAAQSHLATDIKLSRMNPDSFGKMMDLLFEEFQKMFRRIAEYRYGRYNKFKDGKFVSVNYPLQGKMKDENKKILVELYNRIWANYSRAIGGMENKAVHDSVKGQESLQGGDRDDFYGKKRYS